jgi:hypothetical protein
MAFSPPFVCAFDGVFLPWWLSNGGSAMGNFLENLLVSFVFLVNHHFPMGIFRMFFLYTLFFCMMQRRLQISREGFLWWFPLPQLFCYGHLWHFFPSPMVSVRVFAYSGCGRGEGSLTT